MGAPDQPRPSTRHVGIDAARGLAVVLMVQTHAYDAWVKDADRASVAYAITRALGAIPAPLFLLLAGVGIAMAEARASDVRALRGKLVRRGLEIVLWGYAVSLAYLLLDGRFAVPSLLRADILHAIGLSIATCALVLLGSRSAVRPVVVALGALAAGPLFAWAGGASTVPSFLAPLASLFVDVPPYTRFPLFPLVVFAVVGLLVGRWLARPHGARSSLVWIAIAVGLAALAALLTIATRSAVEVIGGALTRAHPAVALNVLDGSARALAVLALGLAMEARSPAWLVRLGRASLFAYAFHIPFCYARLARPLKHRFDMLEATALVVVLVALTLLAVLARDAIRGRFARRAERIARPSADGGSNNQ